MEEERRLPRNIRQIGEREEKVRVYLEDYVYTFIHKLETRGGGRAGILLGSRETAEGKNCFFINGAVELQGLIGSEGVCFSEETWKTVEEEVSKYFSECSICGWFIRGNEDTFPDREMLRRVHVQVFGNEDCLMYWIEENECIWVEDEKRLRRLNGYYVYYERNFQMQNYMLSAKERPSSELVNDRAAQNFRKIMKTKKRHKRSSAEIWTQAGTVAAAAIIFVGSIYLIGRAAAGKPQKEQDQVPAFAVGASVDRVSAGADPSEGTSGEPKETQRPTLKFYKDTDNSQVKNTLPEETGEQETVPLETAEAGAAAEGTQPEETTSAALSQPDGQVNQELPDNEIAGNDQNPPAQPEETSEAVSAGAPVRPQNYTIQPGDTLADISIRFYGSTGMIMEICAYNNIANPNTIFIGQEIELP